MIGAVARMFRGRVTEVHSDENGTEVRARSVADVEHSHALVEGPPEAFVEATVEHDGSRLYVIPFMDAFRDWVRQLKDDEDEPGGGPEDEK